MDKLLDHYHNQLALLEQGTQQFMEQYHNLNAVVLNDIEQPEMRYLIETFAFMNARISKNLEDRFPALSAHFLEKVAPHCLRSLPGFSLVKLAPKANLDQVVSIPKGTLLETTNAEHIYRLQTCYDFDLLPLKIAAVSIKRVGQTDHAEALSCLKITLQTLQTEASIASLNIESIPFFIDAPSPYAELIYEALMTKAKSIELVFDDQRQNLSLKNLSALGFAKAGHTLPYHEGTSLGYRLLLEYFYYRRQFLSFELQGLQKLHAISGNTFSVCIYFDEIEPNIQKACTKESILTSVVPAVNLNAIYLDSIVFDYTQFDYPLRVGQSGAQPKIYAVTEVENREPVDWKFHGGEKPRLELSLPPHKKLAAEPEVVRAKAWVYDAAFGDRQYALQSSESLLPIESIKTIYTCTAQDWWQHNENLLPWVNHLQFGLGQLQQKNGLAFLKNHLSLYLNKREPWQKKSIESLRALKISNIIKRLPREVYAVGPVVHIAIEIDHAAFASHSLYLFAQLLECIFLSLVEVGTGLQVVIQDQYQNICYQGSLKLGAAK